MVRTLSFLFFFILCLVEIPGCEPVNKFGTSYIKVERSMNRDHSCLSLRGGSSKKAQTNSRLLKLEKSAKSPGNKLMQTSSSNSNNPAGNKESFIKKKDTKREDDTDEIDFSRLTLQVSALWMSLKHIFMVIRNLNNAGYYSEKARP